MPLFVVVVCLNGVVIDVVATHVIVVLVGDARRCSFYIILSECLVQSAVYLRDLTVTLVITRKLSETAYRRRQDCM